MQDALSRAADPEILSLALGLPDPELFPVAELSRACTRVLASNRNALQYASPTVRVKTAVCRFMADRGVACAPDQVFLTVGAQQGLSLLARLLLDPGGTVLEETFSYPGFQQIIAPLAPRVITVPTDFRSGIDLDALEQLLLSGVRPAFLYLMADGHNPLGATIPIENRQRLAYMAREFGFPIVEDDPYGFLRYEGTPLPPIRSLESQWIYYVGSFSKVVAPALRVGWLTVPPELIEPLSNLKEASDINTNSFAQTLVAELVETGELPQHISGLVREYGERRRAMNAALTEYFPPYCRWCVPESGVFFWVNLPEQMNASKILERALKRCVAFLPAEAFSRGKQMNGMRLNFGRLNAPLITEAVSRIGEVLTTG